MGVEAGVEMTTVWAAGVVSRAEVRLGAIVGSVRREELNSGLVGGLEFGDGELWCCEATKLDGLRGYCRGEG